MTNTKCNPYITMPKENFNEALKFTLKWEGGISTDQHDPANKGGKATAYGVTQDTYDHYRQSIKENTQPVTKISDTEIRQIYYNNYYKASGANLMPAPLSGVVFDTAVNHGVSKAIKILQDSVGTKKTGKLNHETLNKSICDIPALEVSNSIISERVKHYNKLGESPTYSRFLKGWLNRVNDLSNLINSNSH